MAAKNLSNEVSMERLLEVGAHFGHQVRRWNPKMEDYLYGAREGVHIFDLAKTKSALDEALDVIKNHAKEGKQILFVGTKKQVKEKLTEFARNFGYPFVTERWLGGTLTNFRQLRDSVEKLDQMRGKMAAGEYKSLTKKERLMKQREIENLERKFGGLASLTKTPDLMVIFDTKREGGAVSEADRLGVTTIGVVDSNGDPTLVDYAIPMNDDASQAINYLLELFAQALEEGRKKTKKEDMKESK